MHQPNVYARIRARVRDTCSTCTPVHWHAQKSSLAMTRIRPIYKSGNRPCMWVFVWVCDMRRSVRACACVQTCVHACVLAPGWGTVAPGHEHRVRARHSGRNSASALPCRAGGTPDDRTELAHPGMQAYTHTQTHTHTHTHTRGHGGCMHPWGPCPSVRSKPCSGSRTPEETAPSS